MAPHSDIREEDRLELPHQKVDMSNVKFREGLVLDIGGGGEGIIGLIGGWRVVSIDLSKEELEETRNEALKVVMDAKDLKFLDSSFDTVASFFSLMFVPPELHRDVFREVARVLRPGGKFLVWDMRFKLDGTEGKKVFVFPLTVRMPGGREIDTGYGCWAHAQDPEDFIQMGAEAGLRPLGQMAQGDTFYLEFRK